MTTRCVSDNCCAISTGTCTNIWTGLHTLKDRTLLIPRGIPGARASLTPSIVIQKLGHQSLRTTPWCCASEVRVPVEARAPRRRDPGSTRDGLFAGRRSVGFKPQVTGNRLALRALHVPNDDIQGPTPGAGPRGSNSSPDPAFIDKLARAAVTT